MQREINEAVSLLLVDSTVIEDGNGLFVSVDPAAARQLGMMTPDSEDCGVKSYTVPVRVSGHYVAADPPMPASYEQGGDPGSPAYIEDMKVVIEGADALAKVVGAHFFDRFNEKLLEA